MPYRFVHAADIHLDSPLKSLALRDPVLADLIGNATRKAFVNIIDLCLQESVDALLLAGDLYDGEQTSMKTARFLADQIRRLHQAQIAVYIIRGNHDALSKITKELIFPDSVKLFGGRPDALTVTRLPTQFPVTIHGLSFSRPQAPESFLPRYRPPTEGAVNIGLMHTSLGGAPGHDEYAPCAPAALDGHGFDYWALGHIHKRSVSGARSGVVMAGMPQGRDINESGPKSVTLVTISDDRSVHHQERLTSVAQFEPLEISLAGVTDWRDAITAVTDGLQRQREQTPSEHLVARLRLAGATPLGWRIRRDRDLLAEEVTARFGQSGKTWIEKIEIATTAPLERTGGIEDPLVELRRLIGDDITKSAGFLNEISAIADELRQQLPPECRGILGADEDRSREILSGLVAEGAEDVLARLHASPEAA